MAKPKKSPSGSADLLALAMRKVFSETVKETVGPVAPEVTASAQRGLEGRVTERPDGLDSR